MLNTRFELLVVLLLASPLHWHYSFALQIVSTGEHKHTNLSRSWSDAHPMLLEGTVCGWLCINGHTLTGRSPRRQLKAAPVDVSNSLVYGAGLSAYSTTVTAALLLM